MLETLNEKLFLLINAAPNAHLSIVEFAIIFAQYLLFLPIIIGVYCWLKYPASREMLTKIILTVSLTLIIASIIRIFVFSPRPFTEYIGTNFLAHSASNSFPSKHAAFTFAITMTLIFNKPAQLVKLYRVNLSLSILVACLVSWSRIYLGVHWPLDIIAAIIVSAACAYIVAKSWPHIQQPSMNLFLRSYRILFYPIIKIGLIKY